MRTVVLVIACIAFLIIAFVVVGVRKELVRLGLLLIPSWVCGNYLSDKLFSAALGQSISDRDFSIARIIYGVVVAGLLIGGIYGVGWLIYFWLF